MKITATIISLITIFIFSWFVFFYPKTKNYDLASVSQNDPLYKIELKGIRRLMAHDLVSAILGKAYDTTYEILVPRISGIVNGNEIPEKRAIINSQET